MADFSRRRFLKVLGAAGAVTTIVAGCGGSNREVSEREVQLPEGSTCMDTSGLEEVDVTMRNTLQYTDASPVEGQNCANCSLYVLPEAGSDCGTCLTVKGPVHPEGYCTIWAAQTG